MRRTAFIHQLAAGGCGQVAFYSLREPEYFADGPVLMSADVEMPDGSRPLPCTSIVCGSCGERLSMTPTIVPIPPVMQEDRDW